MTVLLLNSCRFKVVWTLWMRRKAFLRKITCVRWRDSDQYVSKKQAWVDCCDCVEKYNTSGLNNTQHIAKGCKPLENIWRILAVLNRLQTVVFPSLFQWSMLERLWREKQQCGCQLFGWGTLPQIVCLLVFWTRDTLLPRFVGQVTDCTNRLVSSHLDDTSVGRLPAVDVCFIIIIFWQCF